MTKKKIKEPKVEEPKVEEPKVEEPKVEEPKIFAGKKIISEYEKDGGKFVELEGGETIKL